MESRNLSHPKFIIASYVTCNIFSYFSWLNLCVCIWVVDECIGGAHVWAHASKCADAGAGQRSASRVFTQAPSTICWRQDTFTRLELSWAGYADWPWSSRDLPVYTSLISPLPDLQAHAQLSVWVLRMQTLVLMLQWDISLAHLLYIAEVILYL